MDSLTETERSKAQASYTVESQFCTQGERLYSTYCFSPPPYIGHVLAFFFSKAYPTV